MTGTKYPDDHHPEPDPFSPTHDARNTFMDEFAAGSDDLFQDRYIDGFGVKFDRNNGQHNQFTEDANKHTDRNDERYDDVFFPGGHR